MFAQQAGGQGQAAGLPPSLTSFSGRFPACVGTQASSPGPPVAVRHTLSAFPRTVPSSWEAPPPPATHTLVGEGVCGGVGGGSGWGNQSVLYHSGSDPDRCFILF